MNPGYKITYEVDKGDAVIFQYNYPFTKEIRNLSISGSGIIYFRPNDFCVAIFKIKYKMMHPPVILYKGFEIDRFNNIYKDGKPIFNAYWQYNYDLQKAKARIDHSLAEKAKWDLQRMADKQASLKKLTTSCELENGAEAAEQFTNWMETEADKQNEPEL